MCPVKNCNFLQCSKLKILCVGKYKRSAHIHCAFSASNSSLESLLHLKIASRNYNVSEWNSKKRRKKLFNVRLPAMLHAVTRDSEDALDLIYILFLILKHFMLTKRQISFWNIWWPWKTIKLGTQFKIHYLKIFLSIIVFDVVFG